MCNCKWTEIIIALVILILTLFVTASWSQWVVIIAAVVLLLHAFMCKNCSEVETKATPKKKK